MVFAVALLWLFLSLPLSLSDVLLFFLVGVVIVLIAVLRGKSRVAVKTLLVLAGAFLAILAWGEWNLDFTGLQLRSQAILGLHMYQHHDRTQATQLWGRVRELVDQAHHDPDPQRREEAYLILRYYGVVAAERGWVIQGLAEELVPGTQVDLIATKEDPQLAGGAKVLSLLKLDFAGELFAVIPWLQIALTRIPSWQTATNAQIAILSYRFRNPQNNFGMLGLIRQLQTQSSDAVIPIVVAWTDEDGEPHVVCVGCNDEFTLEDARKQAREQMGAWVDAVEDGRDFL